MNDDRTTNNPNKSLAATPVAPEGYVSSTPSSSSHSAHGITVNRPKAPSSPPVTLRAPVATGTFGSRLEILGFVEYLAGATLHEYELDAIFKMQPLKHITLDNLRLRLDVVYCPNSAIWSEADKFASQRSDFAVSMVSSLPSAVPIRCNFHTEEDPASWHPAWETSAYRQTIAYPIYGLDPLRAISPYPVNFLPIRAYKKIFNTIYRDREFQPPYVEYTSTEISPPEQRSSFGYGINSSGGNVGGYNMLFPAAPPSAGALEAFPMPVPVSKNYQTDFRLSVYSNDNPVDNDSLFSHIVTQGEVDEYRLQAQVVNMSDEEIIAKIRGTRIAKENKPYIIGSASTQISMSVQPQTSEEELVNLGAEGALSYTYASLKAQLNSFSAPRDGYVFFLYSIVAPDNGYSYDSTNLEVLKTEAKSFYRPALAKIKDDIILSKEIAGNVSSDVGDGGGYKRRYSEYFRMPLFIRGDFHDVLPTFETNNPSPSFDNFRANSKGFYAVTAGDSSARSASVRLPSHSDWHLLRMSPSGAADRRIDKTDYALHELLLYKTPESLITSPGLLSNVLRPWEACLPQTFYAYGSHKLRITQPIDPSVSSELIRFGEE